MSAGINDGTNGFATVRLNQGNGTLGAATQYGMESCASRAIAFADMNGDGFIDLVTGGTSDGADGYVTIRLGVGDGTFAAATSYASEGGSSRAIGVGDFNRDGAIDVVSAGYDDANNGFASVRLANATRTGTIAKLDLLTATGSRSALTVLQDQLTRITGELGLLGSFSVTTH